MPAKKKKPFRILRPAQNPTHFTYEEAVRAVIALRLRRGDLTEERANALLKELEADRVSDNPGALV